MKVAIEAFLEYCPGTYDADTILEDFASYVEGLGIQPVTLPLYDLVEHILERYVEILEPVERGLGIAREASELLAFVEHFVHSRDCFFYHDGQYPVVEATFYPWDFTAEGDMIDVKIYFAWAPPLLSFRNLRNVVNEGEEFVLKPSAINDRVLNTIRPYNASYYVGTDHMWLRWDAEAETLRGIVPSTAAEVEGAERMDAYTICLEVIATISKKFSGNVKLERVMRCAIPLTVKRRPAKCATNDESAMSPPLKAVGSTLSLRRHATAHDSVSAQKPYGSLLGGKENIPTLPQTTATVVSACRPNLHHTQSGPIRVFSAIIHQNENAPASMSVVDICQEKAEGYRPGAQSPLQLNSLSLARLYDASSEQHPASPFHEPVLASSSAHHFGTPLEMSEREVARGLRQSMHVHQTTEVFEEELPSFQSDL